MNRAMRRVTVLPGFAAVLGFAFALLLPYVVVSQTSDEATLADFRACGALQRDSARLACFDGVLAADREGGEIDETADPAPVAEAVDPGASPATAESNQTQVAVALEAEPEPESERAETPAATTPRPERAEATTESLAQSEPTEPEPASTASTSSSPEEPETTSPAEPVPAQVANIPREEARATQAASAARTPTAAATASDATEAPTFTIVEFNTRIPGSARFVADDGRVFVQTSGGSNYRTFPDVPFPAALEDGALGSQFLRLGPRLRVRVRTVD